VVVEGLLHLHPDGVFIRFRAQDTDARAKKRRIKINPAQTQRIKNTGILFTAHYPPSLQTVQP
jgi:hypothetical protein